jgi:hypothetical protein
MSSDVQDFGKQVVGVVDNISREIGGRGNSVFNPFAFSKNAEDLFGIKNGIGTQASNYFGKIKGPIQDAAFSNVSNAVNEVTGANSARQRAYEETVKQEAQAAQDKLFAENLSQAQKTDIAKSRIGSRRSAPGQRGGAGLDFQQQGDVTDFLGL